MNLAKNFPWARWNYTLHGSIQHSSELIQDNGGFGLGDLSEEPLEANNKDIRKFLKDKSRNSDQVNQMINCMNRTLERSHPKVRALISDFRPPRKCAICGMSGHTIRTHDKVTGVSEISRYDSYLFD